MTVTVRTDRDGATIRPPRVTILTAADSLLNSALAEPDRADLDSFEVKFHRDGQGSQVGQVHRLEAYSNRGADALAFGVFIVEYEPANSEPMRGKVF